MKKLIHALTLSLSAAGLLLATGCGDGNEEVRVYKISHPENHAAPAANDNAGSAMAPFANSGAAAGSVNPSSSMTALPGMESSAAAIDTPEWTVPDGWEILPPTSIRKGNFQIVNGGNKVEVTVTAFPGDVGGLEANVNRWRQQIGLPAATGEALQQSIESIEIDGQPAYYINLLNPDAPDAPGILGGVIPRGSRTWFVKMIGNQAILSQEPPALKSFLRSMEF